MPTESQFPAGHPSTTTGAGGGGGPGYEVRDTNIRAVVAFLVALTLFVIISQVFLWGLLRALSGDKPESATPLTTPDMIHEQRRVLNAKEDAALATIDRAIEQIAERGLPVTGAGRTEAEVNSHAGIAAKPETNPPKAQEKEKNQAKDAPKDRNGQGTAK
jgi:hypothetical protein